MTLRFERGGEPITIEADTAPDGWRICLADGTEHSMSAVRRGSDCIEVAERRMPNSERRFRVPVARTERGIEIGWAGGTVVFAALDGVLRAGASQKSSGSLAAPMPGIVVDVLVGEGEAVAAYQPVAVVEAMKVMATVEAPYAGTVSKVNVTKGSRVVQGEILVEIQPAEPGSAG